MREVLVLKNPIMIDGKMVKELPYDADEITCELFAEADAKKMAACGSKNGNLSGAIELDYSLHLYMGFAAIIAVNSEWTFEDLARVKGMDLKKIMRIGRNFIFESEDSHEESSEEQSEIIPDASTPALPISNEND